MHKKIILFILFFVIPNFISALTEKDLFLITLLPKEIGSYEKIAIHPNGKSIIYTIYQKPLKGFSDDAHFMHSGVPFNRFHSSLYLHELESNKITRVGPVDANCWRPCFSPDGQKIAFYCDKEETSRLWVYDVSANHSFLACKERVRASLLPLMDRPYWSPDSTQIYFPIHPLDNIILRDDDQNEETSVCLYSSENKPMRRLNIPEYGRICSVNLITRESKVIDSFHDDESLITQFMLSRTGEYVAYLSLFSETPTISWNLKVFSTADPQKIFNLAGHLIISGKNAEIVWHPYQNKLAYVKEGKIFIASWNEKGDLEIKEVGKDCDTTFSTSLRFSSDGKMLLAKGNIKNSLNVSEFPEVLYIFYLDKDSFSQISLPKDWSYLSTLETEDGDFWQPEKDSVIVNIKNSIKNAVLKFNLETNTHNIIWRSDCNIKEILASKATNQVFYIGESLNSSQNIYQTSFDFSTITRLTDIDPRQTYLDEITAVIIDSEVPGYDGITERVETTILLPKGTKPNQHLPAIVEVYPGVNLQSKIKSFGGGCIASFPSRLLLEKGYAIILPDLRIRPEGEPGNPLQETVDRLLPQIYQAANLGMIDMNRLGLIGQSFGGYGSAGISAKTNIFRATVCISGIYDLIGCYGVFSKNWEGFADIDWYEKRQIRMGTHPWDDMLRYMNNSPYYLARDINTPLLLIHGEKDKTCPVEEAQKMFTALKRQNKKVDLAIYKQEGHVIENWNHSNAVDAVKRVIQFYNSHLSPENRNNFNNQFSKL